MALSDKIEFSPADVARLKKAGADMAATRPLMAAIGGHLRDAARRRFRDQVTPDGTAWQPSLRARLTGGVTLTDRGILRDSYIDTNTATEARVGSNDIRAAIHHFGGVIRAKTARGLAFGLADGGFAIVRQVTMPARPALGVSTEDREEISALVQDFIDMAAGGTGASA